MNKTQEVQRSVDLGGEVRDALYKVIFNRRDVRGQFKPDPIPPDVLSRILNAAHHAPSVGFMQPWNFTIIQSSDVRERIHEGFRKAHVAAAEKFPEEKQETYRNLKLEGILESPINICITCERGRTGPAVIGKNSIPTMDLFSSVCAVQNLWLAARAEGLGVGWVSIIDERELRSVLNIPKGIVPIAYLCLGYVSQFFAEPELQITGWLPRLLLDELVYFDQWLEQRDDHPLVEQIRQDSCFAESFVEKE